MFYFIAFGAGVLVGWQFPQPQWTKTVWTWVSKKWEAYRTTSLK
jgi:hypothetical protein